MTDIPLRDERKKDRDAVALGRKGGARRAALSPAERSAIQEKVKATWAKRRERLRGD